MKKLIGARRAPEIYRNEIDRVPALVVARASESLRANTGSCAAGLLKCKLRDCRSSLAWSSARPAAACR
jgi:hypothetical protein